MQPHHGKVLVKSDICYLIEEITVRCSSIIENKKVILSLSCPLHTYWVVASEIILSEVVEILLKNMLELSDEAEVIEISISPGDLFLIVDFLNRSKVTEAAKLHTFFADSENMYHTSLYKAMELTIQDLGGEIIYDTSEDAGTFFRLKIKES
ncbi:MAG: ATP-binding protein [Chitinophagaceae bacterium]|nr:ATP-binding protein [Chitinophagaceae bacterium]